METFELVDNRSELEIAKSNAVYWMKKYESAQTAIEMLTAPEQTKHTLLQYASLDEEGKNKIDNLMLALLEMKK